MNSPSAQPISENLWWVIPNQLAGVRKPEPEELLDLQTMGINAIVSVMDDPANLDLYQQNHIPYIWIPIPGGTPPNPEQLQTFKNFVKQQHRLGNAVAVHCSSGRRRTGTLLASYLIAEGASYADAVQRVHAANPEVEMREAQHQFLQKLAAET